MRVGEVTVQGMESLAAVLETCPLQSCAITIKADADPTVTEPPSGPRLRSANPTPTATTERGRIRKN